jgi:hypothetical protein
VDSDRFALTGEKTSRESVEEFNLALKLRWKVEDAGIGGKRMAKALEADERLRES